MAEWEAEIKIRRNGRLVKWEKSFGSSPEHALYAVHNDVELWAQDHDAPQATAEAEED